MIKLIALQTHNILMKIELTCSTYYFRMNYIEIKHYTEIMQQHVKKNLERRKQNNLFGLDQLYTFGKHLLKTLEPITQLFLHAVYL